MEKRKESYLPIITKKESTRISVSDVVMIEKESRKLMVDTEGEAYAYYEKIENVADYLDERFYHILDGCVINLDKVRSMKDGLIYFSNGRILKVNVNSYAKARRRFNEYIKNK